MAKWSEEKAALDEKLADPALYAGTERSLSDELHRQAARLVDDIAAAEERWLDAQHELESLPPA